MLREPHTEEKCNPDFREPKSEGRHIPVLRESHYEKTQP